MKINKLGIVGFGGIGKLIFRAAQASLPAESILRFDTVQQPGLASLADTLSADLVILSVPDNCLQEFVRSNLSLFKAGTIYVTVSEVMALSRRVGEMAAPKKELKFYLTHPLFGPASFQNNNESFRNFKIAVCNYSLEMNEIRDIHMYLSKLGITVIETSVEDHDRKAAENHFIPYCLSHILKDLDLSTSPTTTYSVEKIFSYLDSTTYNKELLKNMYKLNPYAKESLSKFNRAWQAIVEMLTK